MNVKRSWGGVNNIQGTLANGVVKSVQSGFIYWVGNNGEFPGNSHKDIPISPVNANKAALIAICSGVNRGSVGSIPDVPISIKQDGTGIRVTNNGSATNTALSMSWQVIEFY